MLVKFGTTSVALCFFIQVSRVIVFVKLFQHTTFQRSCVE
uniref:Uncharacterized protein n=1 Tax=Anguilla anguilla TaxID=7936 RepID=A0A0E9TJG4_ANGAN